MQATEAHGKTMNGGVDAIGAADIENGILLPVKAGPGIEQLADHRLGHVGDHIIERAQYRIIGTRVAALVDVVKYRFAAINIINCFGQRCLQIHFARCKDLPIIVDWTPLTWGSGCSTYQRERRILGRSCSGAAAARRHLAALGLLFRPTAPLMENSAI